MKKETKPSSICIADLEYIKNQLRHQSLKTITKLTPCPNQDMVINKEIKNDKDKELGLCIMKKQPKMEKDDFQNIVKHAESLSFRDKAIMFFLANIGLRMSDICKLKIEDISIENMTITVYGKDCLPRTVHITEECLLLLKICIAQHPTKHGILFLSVKGNPISVRENR